MADKYIKADRGSIAYDGSGVGNKPTFNINQTAKYRSLLNPLLAKIIDNYDQKPKNSDKYELPDPLEKIIFNDVKVFGETIKECISFTYSCCHIICFFYHTIMRVNNYLNLPNCYYFRITLIILNGSARIELRSRWCKRV